MDPKEESVPTNLTARLFWARIRQHLVLHWAILRYHYKTFWRTHRLRSSALWASFCLALFTAYLAIGLQPAEAKTYAISGHLDIPSIALSSDVTTLSLKGGELHTPDSIVGAFSRSSSRTLLIAHSTTAFQHLADLSVGDSIHYNDTIYYIYSSEVQPKAEISMNQLLAPTSEDTLVLMTCAGQEQPDGDYDSRLIIEAAKGD